MENKILLIDGNSILNRAFYGYPLFRNNNGLCLQGVYGFINIMNKHIAETQPTHLVVSFDLTIPTFRHVMYADYKGTRRPAPDGLSDNFTPLQTLLNYMGIKWVAVPGFEGDDILGTIAKQAQKDDFEAIILSGDKDIFQLIDNHISVRYPKTVSGSKVTLLYNRDKFFDDFGFEPLQYIDAKALMGDASDNIPGVKGIGTKNAQIIISEYKTIENAFLHADEIKPKKYGELLKEQYDKAIFSKKLATIRLDAPIKISYEEMKLNDIWTEKAINYLNTLGIKDKIWIKK